MVPLAEIADPKNGAKMLVELTAELAGNFQKAADEAGPPLLCRGYKLKKQNQSATQ